MSVETWIEEFASTPADSPELKTAVDRLDRDLWKWIGMLPKNLEKHGCIIDDGVVDNDGNEYIFVWGTCSLCTNYLDNRLDNPCIKCPLYKEAGVVCSTLTTGPWKAWADNDDPIPMIEALAGALDKALEEEDGL